MTRRSEPDVGKLIEWVLGITEARHRAWRAGAPDPFNLPLPEDLSPRDQPSSDPPSGWLPETLSGVRERIETSSHLGLLHEWVTFDMAGFCWPGRMITMPPRFPKEFRDDVVRVALERGPGVTLVQIAKDFGIHVGTLEKWLRQERVETGEKPGITRSENEELRELRRRNKLLEQEVEVLRRAAAYLSQAHLPGKGSTRS